MSAPRDDDREAIDRAFAELVAGYHLTADRPDPLPPLHADRDAQLPPNPAGTNPTGTTPPTAGAPASNPLPRTAWADNHPLFVSPGPTPGAPDPPPDERYAADPAAAAEPAGLGGHRVRRNRGAAGRVRRTAAVVAGLAGTGWFSRRLRRAGVQPPALPTPGR